MRFYFGILLCIFPMTFAFAQENLLKNGDMSLDVNNAGKPDFWDAAGDVNTVTQKLTIDNEEGQSARLECTNIIPENPASHAMICQVGRIEIENGKWYRLSFRAKQKGLNGLPVGMALVDMKTWGGRGFSYTMVPEPQWRNYEYIFQATGDATDLMRLQFSFLSTGILWLDDVKLEITDGKTEPSYVWPETNQQNLLPNGSFETGTDTWGTVGRYVTSGWAMPVNKLFGEVVEDDVVDGHYCFKVAMSPQTTPVCYFDCMAPVRTPVRTMLTGNLGWMKIIPDKPYCLSAYLKADNDNCPVKFVIQPFGQGTLEHNFKVGKTWQRYEFTAPVSAEWCSVMLGPDLSASEDQTCTLWMDAVQFEQSNQASDFSPRAPVEVGLSCSRSGNIFFTGEPVEILFTAINKGIKPAIASLTITDFNDHVVWQQNTEIEPSDEIQRGKIITGIEKRGFYRVRLALDGNEQPQNLRMAIISKYSHTDSIFGVNHAYPWDHLQQECVDAGLLWVRDWSMKWHDVQPQPGPFDFTETDYQVNRPRSFGQPILGLLAFPSNNLSSSAPPEIAAGEGYPELGGRTAWAPRSEEEFKQYVSTTVNHYKDRIKWWQVFNEPLYTNHSLPKELGYTGRDYGNWVKIFAQAAKSADPNCKILAGIGAWPDGALKYFEEMFETGALNVIDAVDLHTYPGLTSPEIMASKLKLLTDLMQKYGQVKPMWLTEHGYYADDDFEILPLSQIQSWNMPLADERQQAIYSMRFNVLLLANGVEKIFYHAGTCVGLNTDNTEGTFYEYGGAPRKIYPAVAAFAEIFPPGSKLLNELNWGEGIRAYLFQADENLILATWCLPGSEPVNISWSDDSIMLRDLMGNEIPEKSTELSDAPVFIMTQVLTPDEFMKALIR